MLYPEFLLIDSGWSAAMLPSPTTFLGVAIVLYLATSNCLKAQEAPATRSNDTEAQRHGHTGTRLPVDPSKEPPSYPAVAGKNVVETWRIKDSFRIELVANEPQVCNPITICFDDRVGRVGVTSWPTRSKLNSFGLDGKWKHRDIGT